MKVTSIDVSLVPLFSRAHDQLVGWLSEVGIDPMWVTLDKPIQIVEDKMICFVEIHHDQHGTVISGATGAPVKHRVALAVDHLPTLPPLVAQLCTEEEVEQVWPLEAGQESPTTKRKRGRR